MSDRGRHAVLWGFAVVVTVALSVAAAAHADPSDPPPDALAATSAAAATRPTTTAADDAVDAPLPTTPGDHKLKFRVRLANGKPLTMAYLLHLPPAYASAGPEARHPMLVFLHGAGESGADLAGIYMHGPMTLLKRIGGNADFAATCPFVVLCPQCPPRGQRWAEPAITDATSALIDAVTRRARVDADRVYLTGLSMGAQGTWSLAQRDPDRYAAIAPMNGLAYQPEQAGPRLRTVPVWSAVGLADEPRFVDASRAMEAALANAPVERRFSYLLGNGHDAFWPTYQDPDFFEWLLAHRRPTAEQRARLATAPPVPADSPMPTAAGHYLCDWATRVGDQPCEMDFTLYLPKGYAPGRRYPVLLFLREGDTVGPDYRGLCVHGPDLALERSPDLADRFPFVVISPHWPTKCDWQTPGMTAALLGLLDHVAAGGVGLDRDRVTATGVNAGANGVWRLVAEAPDAFAAAVTVETNVPPADTIPPEQMAAVARAVPGRSYSAAGDRTAIDRVTRAAAGSPRDWRAESLPADATPLGDRLPYADADLLAWIARQSRPAAGSTAAK